MQSREQEAASKRLRASAAPTRKVCETSGFDLGRTSLGNSKPRKNIVAFKARFALKQEVSVVVTGGRQLKRRRRTRRGHEALGLKEIVSWMRSRAGLGGPRARQIPAFYVLSHRIRNATAVGLMQQRSWSWSPGRPLCVPPATPLRRVRPYRDAAGRTSRARRRRSAEVLCSGPVRATFTGEAQRGSRRGGRDSRFFSRQLLTLRG